MTEPVDLGFLSLGPIWTDQPEHQCGYVDQLEPTEPCTLIRGHYGKHIPLHLLAEPVPDNGGEK